MSDDDDTYIYTFYTNPKLQVLRTIQTPDDTVYARFTDEHFNNATVSLADNRHFANYECYDYVKIEKIRVDKTGGYKTIEGKETARYVVTMNFFDLDTWKYEMYIDESSNESNAFSILNNFITFTKKQGAEISKIKGLVLQAGRIGEDTEKLIFLSTENVNETFYHNPKERKKALKNPLIMEIRKVIELWEVPEGRDDGIQNEKIRE